MTNAAPTLCLGEALVDLICERAVSGFGEASAFVPHVGGATANVAVAAARRGAAVALAGAVGGDPWGAWLRRHLAAEGVDTHWLRTLDGVPTPLATIVVDRAGDPAFAIYGETLAAAMDAVAADVEAAVADSGALFFGSNTLVGAVERDVTQRARAAALRLGRPVLIDANLRLERWPDAAEAAAVVRACAPDALLLRTNRAEAEVLTGHADPERAAAALLELDARAVVVTLGADGALVAGEHAGRVPGVPARVRSTVGAGDALTGALVAALALSGHDASCLPEALADGVAAGARATERWGAT